MLTIPVPFLGILETFDRFISFFTDGEGGSDKTEDENEDDDFDSEWGSENEEGDDEEDDKGDDDEDKSKKKDDADKSKKKDSSAVVQKQKYREKLRDAQNKLKEYEDKEKGGERLTPDEKKEKAAKTYLAQAIKEVLQELESEKTTEEKKAQEQFEDELEEVLEENTDVTEDQILDVCEELEVSPSQALKAIRREMKLTGKKKPKMPDNRRGEGEVKEDDKKKEEKKNKSFEESLSSAARSAKEFIKKGLS